MTTDINDLEQQKALDHMRELMSAHWREAQDVQRRNRERGRRPAAAEAALSFDVARSG